jgi:hypothetical protein
MSAVDEARITPPSSLDEDTKKETAVVDGSQVEVDGAQIEESHGQSADDYPHGLRLFLIVFALLLSMFLVSEEPDSLETPPSTDTS